MGTTYSIDCTKRDHGELVTWRCEGGYIALDVPTAFVTGVRRDIELRELVGLMLLQLERINPGIMKSILGAEYSGDRSDDERLVKLACVDMSPQVSRGMGTTNKQLYGSNRYALRRVREKRSCPRYGDICG